MNNRMRKRGLLIIMGVLGLGGLTAAPAALEDEFRNPPPETRPMCYWYWLRDDITAEGITRDLEAMNRVGIGTAFIGNVNQGDFPMGSVRVFSEDWWGLLRHAFKEAARLDIDLGLFNSPGWSQTGGPWIDAKRTMRYLASREVVVQGPRTFAERLPSPGTDAQTIAVQAFPRPDGESRDPLVPATITSIPPIPGITNLIDRQDSTGCVFPRQATSLVVRCGFDHPVLVRSLVFTPATRYFRLAGTIEAGTVGGGWKLLRDFDVSQGHQGPLASAPLAVALPETTAGLFRVTFKTIKSPREAPRFTALTWSARAAIDDLSRKQLGVMYPEPLPKWTDYRFDDPGIAISKGQTVAPSRVINLTSKVDAQGILHWKVPKGEWVILHTAMVPTGERNGPATPEGSGPECDKMSREHVAFHVDRMMGLVEKHIPAGERKVLKYLIADSYEKGPQNWSDANDRAFKAAYGYDPKPWFPVLSGRIVGSAGQSDRFLWDLRRWVADRIATEYVGGLREAAHRHGLQTWLENYGHWGFPSEFLTYGGQSDNIAGEFWTTPLELGSIECRGAASAAHIYGRRQVFAEAFTANQIFRQYPASMKARGDWAFCEGINHYVYHVVVHQPRDTPLPGQRVWFGTGFDRLNTWVPHAKGFVDYHRRCHLLLQQGLPVADIAYFVGEDAPLMDGVRQPECLRGFDFDYINAEVLLERAKVKAGKLLLPEGVSYRVLVLPPSETMRPAVLKQIVRFAEKGLPVIGPLPLRSPSLENFPQADIEVARLSARLAERVRPAGELSDLMKVPPDVVCPEGVLWKHRADARKDIYFLSNQKGTPLKTTILFRVAGRRPELWDAVSGEIRELSEFAPTPDGRTEVSLDLEASGSAFVVFRKPLDAENVNRSIRARELAPPTGSTVDGPPSTVHLEGGACDAAPLQPVIELAGPWEVTFEPGGSIVLEKLEDWTGRPEKGIKHFSGTAIYRHQFDLPHISNLASQISYLSLGTVHCIASVRVNGVDCGTAWCAPWRVEVTGAVRPGSNAVEIAVANTWYNRVAADCLLPATGRVTRLIVNGFNPKQSKMPSGLLGPVRLLRCRQADQGGERTRGSVN